MKMMIPVRDGQLHAEIQGEGEPLVLLHAYSVDMHMWDPQWENLAKRYKVIRFDARGYGGSSVPSGDFSMVEDFTEVLDKLNLTQVHAAGLSMGANTLCDVLACQPQRLKSCILIAGGIGVRPNSPDTDHASGEWLSKTNDEIRRDWLERCAASGGEHWERILPEMRRLTGQWSCWQVRNQEPLTSNPCVETRQRLRNTPPDVPVLCIAGSRDSAGAMLALEEMASLCPDSRMSVVMGAGHFTNMEAPGEVLTLMNDFLDTVNRG